MIFVKQGELNHVSIPRSGREVNPGTMASIKRQARLTKEEFDRIAHEVL